MIHRTARFRVRDEGIERCLEAIRTFIDEVRAEEPGTVGYLSLQDAGRSDQLPHVIAFEDEAAEELHAGSPRVEGFTSLLYPETVDGVTFRRWRGVAER